MTGKPGEKIPRGRKKIDLKDLENERAKCYVIRSRVNVFEKGNQPGAFRIICMGKKKSLKKLQYVLASGVAQGDKA